MSEQRVTTIHTLLCSKTEHSECRVRESDAGYDDWISYTDLIDPAPSSLQAAIRLIDEDPAGILLAACSIFRGYLELDELDIGYLTLRVPLAPTLASDRLASDGLRTVPDSLPAQGQRFWQRPQAADSPWNPPLEKSLAEEEYPET